MNELMRTGAFVASAGLLFFGGWLSNPADLAPAVFDDTGEVFFPAFESPEQVRTLEVIEWDDATAATRRFVVHQQDGVWTIPSHGNYPADAKARMESSAGFTHRFSSSSVRIRSRSRAIVSTS